MPHRGACPAFGFPTPATRAPRGVASSLLLGVAILLGVAGTTQSAFAQSPPSSIMNLVSSTAVSTADEDRIQRYVNYYADQLAAGGPAASTAVDRLLEPVKARLASRSFRGAYGRFAVDRMRGIAADPPTPYAATTAMVILSKVGTPAALTALVDQADVRRQPAWWIRLAAARGVRQLLEDDRNDAIDDRGRLRASRDMAAQAEQESDPRVLRYVLLAVLEADAERLEPGTRQDIHENFAAAVSTVAERATNDARLASSTALSVAAARDAFLSMATTREVQLAFSRALAPAMVELLGAYEAHWPADGSAEAARHAGDIQRLETALTFLVRATNPSAAIPAPPAATAWNERDRPRFTSAVGAWRAALR